MTWVTSYTVVEHNLGLMGLDLIGQLNTGLDTAQLHVIRIHTLEHVSRRTIYALLVLMT